MRLPHCGLPPTFTQPHNGELRCVKTSDRRKLCCCVHFIPYVIMEIYLSDLDYIFFSFSQHINLGILRACIHGSLLYLGPQRGSKSGNCRTVSLWTEHIAWVLAHSCPKNATVTRFRCGAEHIPLVLARWKLGSLRQLSSFALGYPKTVSV